MKRAALAAFAGLLAPAAFAQGLSTQNAAPEAGTTAPPAVQAPEQSSQGQAGQGQAGQGQSGPANLCQELLAFMKAPPPEAPPAAGSGQTASADKPRTAPSGEAVPPRSTQESDSAQQVSGQSGPAHSAPQPNTSAEGEGTTQDAELKSSLSAPVPTDADSTPKESVLRVEEVERLAETNDIAQCQGAARKLRLAGVAVPPPLLALTALDLRYHGTSPAR